MSSLFIFISTLLALISPLIYSRAILKGDARPHRTTRLVLLIITALVTLSLFAQHNTVAIYLAGVSLIQSIIVFILSIKYGMGGWENQDLVCLAIAGLGIILWQTTKNPALALYASILADFTGMIPALIKTYHHPETEVVSFFAIDTVAAVLNLLAVSRWTLQEFSYPLYLILINGLMVFLVLRVKK